MEMAAVFAMVET